LQISSAESIYAGDLLALTEIIEKITDKMRMDLEQVGLGLDIHLQGGRKHRFLNKALDWA
jgi:hypothetical protein